MREGHWKSYSWTALPSILERLTIGAFQRVTRMWGSPLTEGDTGTGMHRELNANNNVQSFHKKPSTPKFATVTPQVTLSGDTCVKKRTVLSSSPFSMDFFAGARFPRAGKPLANSVLKGPARC